MLGVSEICSRDIENYRGKEEHERRRKAYGLVRLMCRQGNGGRGTGERFIAAGSFLTLSHSSRASLRYSA